MGKAKVSGTQTAGLKLHCDFTLCFLPYHFSGGIQLSVLRALIWHMDRLMGEKLKPLASNKI